MPLQLHLNHYLLIFLLIMSDPMLIYCLFTSILSNETRITNIYIYIFSTIIEMSLDREFDIFDIKFIIRIGSH